MRKSENIHEVWFEVTSDMLFLNGEHFANGALISSAQIDERLRRLLESAQLLSRIALKRAA